MKKFMTFILVVCMLAVGVHIYKDRAKEVSSSMAEVGMKEKVLKSTSLPTEVVRKDLPSVGNTELSEVDDARVDAIESIKESTKKQKSGEEVISITFSNAILLEDIIPEQVVEKVVKDATERAKANKKCKSLIAEISKFERTDVGYKFSIVLSHVILQVSIKENDWSYRISEK